MNTAKEIIEEIVALKGLSDSEIACRIQPCSQPTIWRIRNGETKNCGAGVYVALVNLRDELRSAKKRRTVPKTTKETE